MKFDNQLRYATQVIASYTGDQPLHVWLKDFFRVHKQMGSKDRKQLSHLVYVFYRLGHAVKRLPPEERILTGLFLCNDQPGELLHYFRPEWNEQVTQPLTQKIITIQQTHPGFRPTDIFPWKDELSAGIDHEAFCLSFLRQPDLFLRIRPGYEQTVHQKLDQSKTPYEIIPPHTLRLPNSFKVEGLFTLDREVVVQDYSSQRIGEFLQLPATPHFFWDACAASGGKAILTHDLYPGIDITVSDIRESILRNLRQRFAAAGIGRYHPFVIDLTRNAPPDAAVNADLILADVPCTGSGTWARTPEELYFFDPARIIQYHDIQKKIVSKIAPRLSKGAWFVYSTCSVFKKENEEIAALIRNSFGLQPDHMENIKGYDLRADSLFATRFRA